MDNSDSFSSRLGFILVSAGCAIGIGNVWKFPYVAGQNGGGLFVLLYLLFLAIMGVPILTMELAVGRGSKKRVVDAYKKLEPEGSKWHIHGFFCMIGNLMLMMYYTTVSGWMLDYFVKFLTGDFESVNSGEVEGVFSSMLADPKEMLIFMGLTVAGGIIVTSFGLQNGVERISKFMMSVLLGLIVILAIHSLTLPGAKEGMSFYLLPSLARAKEVGFFNVVTAAMNQSFFTLSVGIASMEIFGSYMSKDNSLGGESIRICSLDTFVALMSGMIIFPACFSYGVETTAGPSLIFISLPQVFLNMQGGRIWGTLFFLFMSFASFSTIIAVFENLVSFGVDFFSISRRRSAVFGFFVILITSVPCILGYNIWQNVHLIGARDILDSEDFIVSNLLLPVGSMIFLLFCVTKWGWGFDNYLEEANTGNGFKLKAWMKPYFTFVLPVLILVIFITGLM